MSEYLVQSEDLLEVANAIRAKCRTTAQIEFPDGFISTIKNSGLDKLPLMCLLYNSENPDRPTCKYHDPNNTAFDFEYVLELFSTQGKSTLDAPYQNYKIVLPAPVEMKSSWGLYTQYVLKADWADPNKNRNVCCAKLWAQVCEAYPDDEPDFLKTAVNHGAIDGFPILLYNQYTNQCAIYNLTLPKFKTLNLPVEAVAVKFSKNSDTTIFSTSVTLSDNGWAQLALGQFSNALKTSWYPLTSIDDVLTYNASLPGGSRTWDILPYPPSGSSIAAEITRCYHEFDFSTNVQEYKEAILGAVLAAGIGITSGVALSTHFSVPQLMRYYLFTWYIRNLDGWNSNMIMVLYNDKLYPVPYDLDLTFGINMNDVSNLGEGIHIAKSISQANGNIYYEAESMLWQKLMDEKYDNGELQTVLNSLSNVLSVANVNALFSEYEAQYKDIFPWEQACLEVTATDSGVGIYGNSELSDLDYRNFDYDVSGDDTGSTSS